MKTQIAPVRDLLSPVIRLIVILASSVVLAAALDAALVEATTVATTQSAAYTAAPTPSSITSHPFEDDDEALFWLGSG
jgi:hypothetical protein